MSMTLERAKSELMQIYGMLSPDKQRAIDTLVKIEPCEDAISRQAVIEIQAKYAEHMSATKFWQMRDDIKTLPPVNPQGPKTGHWTHDGSRWKNRFICSDICSECGYKLFDEPTNYCPNCGCRMVEPQESEVQNESID